MKSIKVTDIGQLKNELNKYKRGKKLDIRQFNQAARLAWLGLITLSPLDPDDPECLAWLLHVRAPEGFAAHFIDVDEDVLNQIHILDSEQGRHLADIMRQGLTQRAEELQALDRRDFYFGRYFQAAPERPGADPK